MIRSRFAGDASEQNDIQKGNLQRIHCVRRVGSRLKD